PAVVARWMVAWARRRRLVGLTRECVYWGDGPGSGQGPDGAEGRSTERLVECDKRDAVALEATSQEPHGQFAARIAEALQADLSHNEFGQWSSAEVQHTVIWALKDLARRLRVLQFDMGETFELTDESEEHTSELQSR